MNKTLIALCTLAAAFAVSIPDADAAGRVKARGAVQNAEGGVTAGRASAARGPNGGAAARARGVKTDGQGNGQAASGGVYRGPNGGTAGRAGTTTWNADGSAQHQSGGQWNGPNSSGSTQGGFVRDTDGNVSGGRTTSATGAQGGSYDANTTYGNGSLDRSVDATGRNGNSYQSTTTATRGEGVDRTATCYDPNGNVIACRP
jgi:hypothetical protein